MPWGSFTHDIAFSVRFIFDLGACLNQMDGWRDGQEQ